MDISGPLPPKFVPGPLPRASLAPQDPMYSGLLECPLTTRLVKVVDGAYAVESGGAVAGCGASTILTFQECYHAAAVTIGMVLVCLILHVVFERLLSNLSRL